MTVEAMVTTISNREYLMWRAFYKWRASEREAALERARGRR